MISQIETNNKANEKIQFLDMKIINEKKQFKEENRKIKALRQEIVDLHNKNNSEFNGKDAKIKELEVIISELQKKLSSLEEESNFSLS